MNDDPFSSDADPYPPLPRISLVSIGDSPDSNRCACASTDLSGGPSLSRRRALLGVGVFALLPAMAQGEQILAPCIQRTQKPQPCRHKFCRYYAGEGDYHGR